jgi:hypothetical protein
VLDYRKGSDGEQSSVSLVDGDNEVKIDVMNTSWYMFRENVRKDIPIHNKKI